MGYKGSNCEEGSTLDIIIILLHIHIHSEYFTQLHLSSQHILLGILNLARFIAMDLNESVPTGGNYGIVFIPVADERYFTISWVMTF